MAVTTFKFVSCLKTNLTYYSSHNFPSWSTVSEFTQVYPLPGSKGRTVLSDGNTDGTSEECSLDMCRHIVGSFKGVFKSRKILRDNGIQQFFKVSSYCNISVLIDGERGGGVLNEKVKKSRSRQRGNCLN